MTLTHLSLFTGIGGIDLAAEWAGFETIAFCEIDSYCQKVLNKHWPNVPIIKDVKDVTRESVMAYTGLLGQEKCEKQTARVEQYGQESGITLISGGFPCQPHSVAGKRKGSADERNLWPEFRRIIGEIKPRWVLAENVPGLFSSDSGRFFGSVLADLAALGYSVGWATYGAVDVGALHRRNRVFIVAYSREVRCGHWSDNRQERHILSNLNRDAEKGQSERSGRVSWTSRASPTLADSRCSHGTGATINRELDNSLSSSENASLPERPISDGEQGIIADTELRRCKECWRPPASERFEQNSVSVGVGNDSNCEGLQGQPITGSDGEIGQELRNKQSLRCYRTGQAQWGIEPSVGRVANGIPRRVDRLKCLGNAVVPQQVYPILKAIADIERSHNG